MGFVFYMNAKSAILFFRQKKKKAPALLADAQSPNYQRYLLLFNHFSNYGSVFGNDAQCVQAFVHLV